MLPLTVQETHATFEKIYDQALLAQFCKYGYLIDQNLPMPTNSCLKDCGINPHQKFNFSYNKIILSKI
jgi:hypothetical protein